jgi:hypothetical protein
MNLSHLSTNTPASEVSSANFDDGYNSNDSEVKSLDDILRNSPAANLLGLKESLPEEDEDVPNPDESSEEKEAQENDEESANDLDENEESKDSEEDKEVEDDESTQNADLPTEEDIDWEYQVPVTVDGKTEYVTLEEIRKGYSTDKHLSQKGRELGELKKQLETERTEKLQEIVTLGQVIHEELTAVETNLASQYHKLKSDIDKAREEGDTYTARELKEQLEATQEKYWTARNKREEQTKAVIEKIQIQQTEQQQALLKEYESKITDLIPDYSEKVAKSVREFAIKEGVPEALLDNIYSPEVVRFINDYRKLKTAKDTGEAKRKTVPVTKSIPSKKGTPQSQKEREQTSTSRQKVLSGQGSKQDELDFLKRISSVSKKL